MRKGARGDAETGYEIFLCFFFFGRGRSDKLKNKVCACERGEMGREDAKTKKKAQAEVMLQGSEPCILFFFCRIRDSCFSSTAHHHKKNEEKEGPSKVAEREKSRRERPEGEVNKTAHNKNKIIN